MEDLRDRASVQYDEWLGTVAADGVDFNRLESFLGIERDAWRLVVVDVLIFGGGQSILAWALPAADGNYESVKRAAEAGLVEVTKVVERDELPADHDDTNPPAPPVLPLTWAMDLLALGFKRLHIRMENIPESLRALEFQIIEVASVVDPDDS